MISVVRRRAPTWHDLTVEDARIFAKRTPLAARVLLRYGSDARDADLMYMLTDEAPGAARCLLSQMGLTSDEQKALERAREAAYRRSGC